MIFPKTILAAVLTVLPAMTEGARSFYNSGTTGGWSYVRREHQGTVDQVTNTVYEGSTALKMTQRYDPNYGGRYHSEVDVNNGYRRHETKFYGFMFRLSDTWEFSNQGYNLAQFIANRPGAGCGGDDWMPTTMIFINGNQLGTRIVSGNYRQPDCSRNIRYLNNIGTVRAGVWHKVILQVTWKSDSTGQFKVWLDGNKIFEQYNVATTVNDDVTYQFRVGLYANSWYDDGYMAGNQPFRQIWYDEIAMGSEFRDVDPNQS